MIPNPLYIIYGLAGAVLVGLVWIIRLEMKIRKLLLGKDAKSLEDSIVSSHKNLEKLNEFQKEAVNHFVNIEKRLKRSLQGVSTIRFNPFKGNGEGGSQSFATSFVSENGDGVVISSLYSRERMSVFSKPLTKFESQFETTAEEKEAITNAKNSLK